MALFSMATVEMKCAASPGGTARLPYCRRLWRSTRFAAPHPCRLLSTEWTLLGKTTCSCVSGESESCARVTAYCSFVTAGYDISCGGPFPEYKYAQFACGRQPFAAGRSSRIPPEHRPSFGSGAEAYELCGPETARSANA